MLYLIYLGSRTIIFQEIVYFVVNIKNPRGIHLHWNNHYAEIIRAISSDFAFWGIKTN
jgi:hypothetical protein